jgi:outer membrane protein OmpA-like peptidoglycan-associated protein
MADLDVQPKRSSPWWLWLLVLLIAIVVLLFILKGCKSKPVAIGTTDSTMTKTVAVTQPDWTAVDFNAAKSSDADITDTAIEVRGNNHYTLYSLGENVLFASGQAALQGNAGDKLRQVVASLNKRFKGASIGVYGSTDSTGSTGQNKALGAGRAAAVKKWLVTTGGLDSSLVSVHSLGESKPVASNATASGRQQNRNVTIVAFPNK